VRHVRIAGLCLCAVLALCAFGASSALASGPEWVRCEAKAGGKYENANCTEKAKKGSGAYELLNATQVGAQRVKEGKSKNIPFTGSNVGAGGVLSTQLRGCTGPVKKTTRQKCTEESGEEFPAGEAKIECTSEENTGESSGKSGVANVAVVFKGCKLFGSIPCTNSAEEGEVLVNPLKGELGLISKSENKVGLLLEPEKKDGEFAKFDCGGILETIVGVGNDKEGTAWTSSGCAGYCPGTTPAEEKNGGYDGIISRIEPVNQMTSEFTQVYTSEYHENSGTCSGNSYKCNYVVNVPASFEKKHIELLEDWTYVPTEPSNSTGWSTAGEEITNSSHPEEASEIKA
jgi:hypothetical protein